MIRFNPERGEVGASSSRMREETVERAWQIGMDYPLFGVGLGNFREVSRQVYFDDFYRPPHNSYLWALAEGGMFVLAGYGLLFWVTWKDLQQIRRLAHRDPEMEVWASAIRVVFVLFFFFSAFADLWLNPITYVLLGLVITTRRYVETLPEVTPVAVVAVGRGASAARHDGARRAVCAATCHRRDTAASAASARASRSAAIPTRVYTLRPGGEVEDELRAAGVPVTSLSVGARLSSPRSLRAIVAAARGLRRDRVDIVHGYQWRPALVGALVGRLARVPLRLASKRSLTGEDTRARHAWRRIARQVDTVIVNANALREEGEHLGMRCRWELLQNGIDAEAFRVAPAGPAARAGGWSRSPAARDRHRRASGGSQGTRAAPWRARPPDGDCEWKRPAGIDRGRRAFTRATGAPGA